MAISGPQPFWTLAPYNDPGSLMGGIRRKVVTQKALQADAFRSGAQSQRVSQTARSQSGSQTTNDQAQTVDLSQNAVALNRKRSNVDSELQMLILDSPLLLEAGGGIAPITTVLNDLQLDTFIDDGDDPSFGTPIIDETLPATANTLITGDEIFVTGTEPDGTPVSGTFTYGVTGTTIQQLVNFIDGLYTNATADYPVVGEDEGRIRLRADYGGDYGLSISLSNQANFVPANTAREVVTFSEVSGDVTVPNETRTGSLQLGDSLTSSDATSATFFGDLTGISGAPFVLNDVIRITGTDEAGNPVSSIFTVGDPATTNLQQLLNAIDAAYLPGGGATSSIVNGRIVLTSAIANELTPHLDVRLSSTVPSDDGFGNQADDPFGTFALTGPTRETHTSSVITDEVGGGAATSSDPLNDLDIVNRANDPLDPGNRLLITGTSKSGPVSATFEYGTNGTTIGDLVDFLNGTGIGAGGSVDKYPGSEVTLDGSGRLVLKENVASADPGLDLNIVDPGPNIQFPAFSGPPALPLFSYLAGSDAADDLSRAAANAAQDQGGDQSAFARVENFEGTGSTSYNNLTQAAQATQTFDVDLDSIVINTTVAVHSETFFNEARFRRAEVNDIDNSAQAIFTAGQRQGAADDVFAQTAVADGGDADNTLTQTATLVQSGNVLTDSTHNLDRHETYLIPRSTDVIARIEGNSAINSSAASQEQNLMQSSAGGANDDAAVTENDGTAQNLASSSASNTDTVTVANSISVLI